VTAAAVMMDCCHDENFAGSFDPLPDHLQ